ncbi:MAG: C25 family cysteine peptidase [candidate division Zixibacteria bacterium]
MKVLTILITALILAVGNAFSADAIELIKFDLEKLVIDGQKGEISLSGLETISIEGYPSLPITQLKYHSYLNQDEETLFLRVIESDTIQIDFQISKNKADIPTSALNKEIENPRYFSRVYNIYPSAPGKIEQIFMSNYSIWSITVFPIQFLGEDKIVFNHVIEISSSNNRAKIYEGLPNSIENNKSKSALDRLSSGSGIDGCPLGNEFVVVTSPEFVDAFKVFIDLKRSTGYNAALAITDSIYANYSGIDEAEALRNYLHDFYNNGGKYVLLGGDENQVPVRYAYFYNTTIIPALYDLMICDLYFADFDGDWDFDGDGVWGEPTQDHPDLGAEVLIGRLPFSQASQVIAYTEKLRDYLFNPGSGDTDYLKKSVFFSSDQMRDYFEGGQQYRVAESFPAHIDNDCERLAEDPNGNDPAPTGPYADDALSGLSQGYGFVNILAHGRPDGFVLSSREYNQFPKQYLFTAEGIDGDYFSSMEDNNKIGFYYSVSCDQASFDLETLYGQTVPSVAEELLSLENSGPVGMIAFTRWGWVGSSYKLMASFYGHLFDAAEGNPVEAMYRSWIDFPYYRDQIYGQNYYGDPSIELYLDRPEEINISGPYAYPIGGELSIHVDVNDVPLAGKTVVINNANDIYLFATTDLHGIATFSIPDDWTEIITVTVNGHGYISSEITLSPSIASDVDDNDLPIPLRFSLVQNYPNPFNPTTTIEFMTSQSGRVELTIYNILGNVIDEPVAEYLPAGIHQIIWEGTDMNNNSAPSGIYFYRLKTAEGIITRKMALVK